MAAELQAKPRINPGKIAKMLESMVGRHYVTEVRHELPVFMPGIKKPAPRVCEVSIRVRDGVDAQITCRADTDDGFRIDRGVCLVSSPPGERIGAAENIDQARFGAPALTHIQAARLILDVIEHVRTTNAGWEQRL